MYHEIESISWNYILEWTKSVVRKFHPYEEIVVDKFLLYLFITFIFNLFHKLYGKKESLQYMKKRRKN